MPHCLVATSCTRRLVAVSSTWVFHMTTDPSKRAEDPTPAITPERAQELVREGETLARAYRQRIEKMWTISKDARQTRAR